MPRKDDEILRTLNAHIDDDEKRFDGIESKLARISGELYVIGGIVIASGVLNFLGHVGG